MSEKKVGKKKPVKKTVSKKKTKSEIIETASGRTDTFADKIRRNQKTLIMMGLSFVALVIVIIAILMVSFNKPIDSSFFHDSENKIVLTMDKDSASIEGSAYEPYITHMVYYHDGTNITGLEAYYEYESEEVAKAVYDHLEPNGFDDAKYRRGRFVVFKVNKSKYEGATVEEIRREIELLKQIDALILDYDENTLGKYGKWYMPEPEE